MACFTVRFSRITMQFVVILLPISSSSKERIISISFRTCSSRSWIRSLRFSLSICFKTSARASVSILERMAAAFFTSISSRYFTVSSSSRYSKTSASILLSRIRYSLLRSAVLNSLNTSARSFSWKSCSLSLKTAGETLLRIRLRISFEKS